MWWYCLYTPISTLQKVTINHNSPQYLKPINHNSGEWHKNKHSSIHYLCLHFYMSGQAQREHSISAPVTQQVRTRYLFAVRQHCAPLCHPKQACHLNKNGKQRGFWCLGGNPYTIYRAPKIGTLIVQMQLWEKHTHKNTLLYCLMYFTG